MTDIELERLRREFIVCHAAAYPAPFRPTPNTLEQAQRFAEEHRQADGSPAVVKSRLVSDWSVSSSLGTQGKEPTG